MAKGLGRGLDAFFSDDNDDTIEKVTKKDEERREKYRRAIEILNKQ